MNKNIVGYSLLGTGLIGFLVLMMVIVFNHQTNGDKPSILMAILTLTAWGIFFVGKSMTRAVEKMPSRDA